MLEEGRRGGEREEWREVEIGREREREKGEET
jgi:hypothetical protein